MSDYYDTMQVCKRWGHKITEYYDKYPTEREEFCQKCGSATTHICETCDTNIRGYHHFEGVIGGGGRKHVPLNCHKCGAAYPWKTKLLWKKAGRALVAPLKYVIDAIASIFARK